MSTCGTCRAIGRRLFEGYELTGAIGVVVARHIEWHKRQDAKEKGLP